jgi:hypothetical protein
MLGNDSSCDDMSLNETFTYAYTKHVAYPADAIGDVAHVYGLLGTSDRVREQLLRIGASVREGSSTPIDNPILLTGNSQINSLREEAYNLLNSEHPADPAIAIGGKAIAAANLFQGTFDDDGMYLELKEPFLEANILPLLHANKNSVVGPEYYLQRLYYRKV